MGEYFIGKNFLSKNPKTGRGCFGWRGVGGLNSYSIQAAPAVLIVKTIHKLQILYNLTCLRLNFFYQYFKYLTNASYIDRVPSFNY